MRAVVIIAAIISFAVSPGSEADEQVVTIRLTPDPAIRAHIAAIAGPDKSLWISVSKPDSSTPKRQRIVVHGPITESDLSALVRSVLAGRSGYWTGNADWEVRIEGDDEYAVVDVSMHCGELCGSGKSYTFAFRDGKWIFEYSSDEWIS